MRLRATLSLLVCSVLGHGPGCGGEPSGSPDTVGEAGGADAGATAWDGSGSPGTSATTGVGESGGQSDGVDPPTGGCFAAGEVPPTVEPAGFAMPTLDDERAAYTAWGWTWEAGAEPNHPEDPSYTVGQPDIHGDTEGDDLWSYLMMYERTGQQGYLDRAEAWASYFKGGYLACDGPMGDTLCSDLSAFGGDHLYGWGLVSWYEATGDEEALAAAVQLAERLEALYAPDTTFGCKIRDACMGGGLRGVGRNLLLAVRVAEATGDPRWADLRDRILQLALESSAWDEGYNMVFMDERRTDDSAGAGSWAAGLRIQSPFHVGWFTEALDQAYRTTGREELRDRIVGIAAFVDAYGLDPVYGRAGSRFGVDGNGDPYHNYAQAEPVDFWDPVYTTSLVNALVRGYRYTCDAHYHERARHFLERGTKGIADMPTQQRAPDGVVHHFVDSRFSSSQQNFYLAYNKGELQYTYLLFAPVD